MTRFNFPMAAAMICTAILSIIYTNIYSSPVESNALVVNAITISGNKITNEKVILREIPFKIGDTINIIDIPLYKKQVRENLENIQLFNFIYIDTKIDSSHISWNIGVEERWYIWPVPIIEYADRNLSSFLYRGDYSRINYGSHITFNNFRGMRDQLTLRLVLGYRKQISLRHLTYSLDKEKRHGMKSWISYVTNHEVPYINYENKQVFHKSTTGKVRSAFNAEIAYQYRPALHWYHTFTIGYQRASVSDTIAILNPNFFGNGMSKYSATEISYSVFLERRNPKIFPLSGYFANFKVSKIGLFPIESISFWSTYISGGYYTPIFSRLFAGTDVKVKISNKANLPYYLNDAIGYNDYIRGYEHYVTSGSQFYINKNSIKYQLIKPKVVVLPFIPEGKFQKTHITLYWSLFADTGMVKSNNNLTNNSLEGLLLYGYGTGLYLVTYYDIVFRMEYSINRLGEGGFFIHFGTPFLNN